MNRYFISALVVALGLSFSANAQQQPWTEGELEEEKVVIVKSRENELPPANRSFKKIPPTQITSSKDSLQYKYSEPQAQLQPLEAKMRVVRIKADPPAPYFTRFVKLGIGNYFAPSLLASLSSPQQKNYFYNLQLNHNSAARGVVDKGNSGFGESKLQGAGAYVTDKVATNFNAYLERNRYNFYGYLPQDTEPDKSDIKQAYFGTGAGFTVATLQQENSKFNAAAGLNIGYVNSSLNLSESRIGVEGKIAYEISELLALDFKTDMLFSSFNQMDEDAVGRTLVKFQPGVSSQYGAIKLSGGFNFALVNDFDDNGELKFFPRLQAEIRPTEKIKVYAGFNGDVEPVTYYQLTQENPWLGDSLEINFTEKTFAFNGGVQAAFGSLGVHAGFEVASLKNQYLFLNDSSDISQFQLVYDRENITRISFWTQANYSYKDKWKLENTLKLFNYTTDDLDEAYHLPTVDLNSTFRLNVYDKIYGSVGLNVLSGIKAVDFTGDDPENISTITLDPVVKLDLGGEYRFSEQATAFLQFNNLLNRSDSRYLRYPGRKMVVQIGGTYAF